MMSLTFVSRTLSSPLSSAPCIPEASYFPSASSFDFSLRMSHPGPSCQNRPLIGSPFRERRMKQGRQKDRITYLIKLNSCFSQKLAFFVTLGFPQMRHCLGMDGRWLEHCGKSSGGLDPKAGHLVLRPLRSLYSPEVKSWIRT